MKNLLVAIFLVSSVSSFAQEMTRIEADYRCEGEGGGIAFNTTTPSRVWQTEPGESSGLELTVSSFKVGSCKGCYTFEAVLMGQVKVRGKVASSKLNYEAFNQETNKWQAIVKGLKCIPVK